nr:hypothetical protein [Tanacetum cinerariifolium]
YAQPEHSNELFQKLLEDLQIINKELKCNHPTFSDNNEDHSVQHKEYLKNPSNEIAASNSNQEKEGPPQDFDILAPILSTKQPEYSPSMGYENPNTTPKTESDKIIKSGVEELVPILSENEVTSEDKKECDMPVCENSPICDDHSEIFSDSKNNDDISSDNDDFKDIEYVEASLPDLEIVSAEEENVVYHEEEEERLINVLKNDISDDSSNDPLLEEADLFLASDNSIPSGIDNFAYDSEGDIRFLEALLSDNSIPFSNNESSDSDFDNPSFPRPPPKPPDFELDAGEEISVVMNNSDEFECLDPRDEFDNDDYSSFMFVICSKLFISFFSAESEDTIFDPGISI